MKTNNEWKHTPTPWEIRLPYPVTLAERDWGKKWREGKIDRHACLLKQVGDHGDNVAQIYATKFHTQEQNAAFIVRAVNSMDANTSFFVALGNVLRAVASGEYSPMLALQAIKEIELERMEAIAQAEAK